MIPEFEDILISPAHSGQEGPLCFVRRLLRLRSYGKIHMFRIVGCDFALPGFCSYRFRIEQFAWVLPEYPRVFPFEIATDVAQN